MKNKLALFNLALFLYVTGLLAAIGISFGTGAVFVLMASAIIVFLFASQLYITFRNGRFWSLDTLVSTLIMLLTAELFIQGFSVAIGQSLLGFSFFFKLHVLAGFILLGLLSGLSFKSANNIELKDRRYLLFIVIGVSSAISLVGHLGFAGILPGTVKLVYYSYVFLTFAYLVYFLSAPERHTDQRQFKIALGLGALMIVFWLFRWQIPNAIPPGIYRILLHLGFVTAIVLPIAIWKLNTNYFFIVFLFYSTFAEIHFIGFNKDFKYLTDVGINGCVGYENALEYPVNEDPGIPVSDLLKPPSDEEITIIREEWKRNDFSPSNIHIEYAERNGNGDSIKVISHDVNGLRHYGLIRIPAGLRSESAPILLVLHGGGSSIDVLETDVLYRIASGSCRDVLNNFIVIAPSFRGDIVRGKDFCFRSEGYTGDVWAGAAEDAAFFLEAVKKLYKKDENSKTLAIGVSRGATVALILSALTDKVSHAIAISTHTDLLNEDVFRDERVGSDFPRIFFTPRDSPENIRKRILTSSPLYFAEHISSFEIHQGTADHLTTVRHARAFEHRVNEVKKDSNARFYFYEGKGHGYDDDMVVCSSLTRFLQP